MIMRKATGAFDGVESTLAKVDNVLPGISRGNDGELFQKVKSIRELAESFNKRSGVLMEEGRRTLLDISESAVRVTRKFDPQAVSGDGPRAATETDPEAAVGQRVAAQTRLQGSETDPGISG